MASQDECDARENWKCEFMKAARKEDHYKVMDEAKYLELVQEVAKESARKTPQQYRRLQRFDILEIGGVTKLISKSKDDFRYFTTLENCYDIIEAAHINTGHGGRDRIISETSKKYANITRELINIYLSMCEVCHKKKVKRKRGLVSKPILHSEMNSRCQVDLVDFQAQAHGPYKFLMVYQDHLTKIVVLRPLSSKRAEEVC